MKWTVSTKYLLYGILFGFLFPLIASVLLTVEKDGSVTLSGIAHYQSTNSLLWIIDSAPLFLGILAWMVGRKQSRINDINSKLESKVKEQTAGLTELNKALRIEIEERNNQEEELFDAKNAAEEGVKAKDQFLSNMSHEIRTPMNGILGMTELLLNGDLNEEQRRYLSAIDYSAKNLLVIINDILDLSKINSEKLEFEKVNFKIMEVIQSVENTLSFKASEKGVSFSMIVDKKIPDKLSGDPVRLSQILLNIAGNAVKFTERGSVEVFCQLLGKNEYGYKIAIKVKDTGIGIPADKLSSVFESFTQAHPKITNKFGGTGLGLPISKKLIELQGGELEVESVEGKGSTFSFTLQYGYPEKEEEPVVTVPVDFSSLKDKPIRILLVEDNQINQLVAKSFLDRYNFQITIAENGREALDHFERQDFDIILMDVQMPVMDGLEATRYIREKLERPKRDVKIMAMTASVLKKEIDKCFNAGMDEYIAKPFVPKELYEKIVSLVES